MTRRRIHVTVTHRPDLDDVAVDRIIVGDSPRQITGLERLAAVATPTGRGYTATQIAALMRSTDRTVYRYRRLARLTSQPQSEMSA